RYCCRGTACRAPTKRLLHNMAKLFSSIILTESKIDESAVIVRLFAWYKKRHFWSFTENGKVVLTILDTIPSYLFLLPPRSVADLLAQR
ncbi:MAG: hypothetical protein WCJ49_04330, partial [Deltaproteobacteria bacterium]